MKISPRRIRNLIKLPHDFAVIEDIDEHGRIVYDLSLYADIFSCLRSDVITIRVSVYKNPPITRTPIFHKELTSRDVISGLKTHFARSKGRIKRSRLRPIAVTTMDVSRVVSNENARKTRLGRKQFQNITGIRPVVRAIPNEDLTDAINPPELTVSIRSRDDIDADRTPRRSAIMTILRDGIDPSSIADGDFPVITLRESVQGVKGSDNALDPRVKQHRRSFAGRNRLSSGLRGRKKPTVPLKSMTHKSTRERSSLLAHLGDQNIMSATSDFLSKTKIVRTMVSSRWEKINENISIDRRRVKGAKTFHMLFEVIRSDGTIVDTFSRSIDHEENLVEYLTPDHAPIIKVKRSMPGQNVLVLSQRDDVATSVEVSRRFIDPKSSTMESSYRVIGTIPVAKNDGEVRLDDMVNNTRVCLYRAVAVGPRGHRSPRFHGTVSRAIPIPLAIPAKKLDTVDPSHISVFAETVGDSVIIRLTNIPEGPTAAYVIAYDLTLDRMRKSRRVVGSNSNPEEHVHYVGSKTVDLIFTDTDIKDRHIYEYRCVMIYPNGREQVSVSYEIHEFRRNITQEPVVLSLGKPELRMDETGNVSLSYDIGARFTDPGMDTILEAMESAGITGAFLSEINRNRRKFNSLLSFLILRQDSVTGETETFGRHSMGRFVDDMATRAAAGVSEMLPGRSYRYVVQLLIRDAETLFNSLSSREIDIERQTVFRTKMAKFFNPDTLMTGALPSTAAMSGYTVGSRRRRQVPEKFQSGRTAVFQSIDISVPRRRIEVTNLEVTMGERSNQRKSNIIQWDIEGDESRIDHFLVIGRYRGRKHPIGNVHHASSDGSYRFIDTRLSRFVGAVSYSIVPVLTNFVYVRETDPVTIRQSSSEPSFILEA